MKDETKSHVGMGHEVCPVCAAHHTETVLIDKRLKPTLTRDMRTGVSMCPEHAQLRKDGYIALVVAEAPEGATTQLWHEPKRTGDIVHVRASSWEHIFNVPVPPSGMCFIDSETFEVMKHLQSIDDKLNSGETK